MIRKVGFGADVLVEDELAVASMDADACVGLCTAGGRVAQLKGPEYKTCPYSCGREEQ